MANTVSLKYLDDAFGTGNQAYAYISVAGDVVDTGNVKKIANGITYSDAPLPSRQALASATKDGENRSVTLGTLNVGITHSSTGGTDPNKWNIIGSENADVISTNDGDTVVAGGGNDTVVATKDAIIDLGAGDDRLNVSGGSVTGVMVDASKGNNTISYGNHSDATITLTGEGSTVKVLNEFTALSTTGGVNLTGTDKKDKIDLTGAKYMKVNAGDGDDEIAAGTNSEITVGSGRDVVNVGSTKGVSVYVAENADGSNADQNTINVNGGEVTVASAAGEAALSEAIAAAVTVNGGMGNDTVVATNKVKNVVVNTGNGDDAIYTHGEEAVISSGAGADSVTIGGANTTVDAGANSDYIEVQSAGNVITTGEGMDTVLLTSGTSAAVSVTSGKNSSDYIKMEGPTSVGISGDASTTTVVGSDLGSTDDNVIDASKATNGIHIIGGKEKDSIIAGVGANIDAGDGDDTIIAADFAKVTLGGGKDIIEIGAAKDVSVDASGTSETDADDINIAGGKVTIIRGDYIKVTGGSETNDIIDVSKATHVTVDAKDGNNTVVSGVGTKIGFLAGDNYVTAGKSASITLGDGRNIIDLTQMEEAATAGDYAEVFGYNANPVAGNDADLIIDSKIGELSRYGGYDGKLIVNMSEVPGVYETMVQTVDGKTADLYATADGTAVEGAFAAKDSNAALIVNAVNGAADKISLLGAGTASGDDGDYIAGSDREDTLIATGANVTLKGGAGKDVFDLRALTPEQAATITIEDFVQGEDVILAQSTMPAGSSGVTADGMFNGYKYMPVKTDPHYEIDTEDTKIYAGSTNPAIFTADQPADKNLVVDTANNSELGVADRVTLGTVSSDKEKTRTVYAGVYDTVIGSSAADMIYASGDEIAVSGGKGDDMIVANGIGILVDGGEGADNIQVGSGEATITAGAGKDIIVVYGAGAKAVLTDYKLGEDSLGVMDDYSKQDAMISKDGLVGNSDSGARIAIQPTHNYYAADVNGARYYAGSENGAKIEAEALMKKNEQTKKMEPQKLVISTSNNDDIGDEVTVKTKDATAYIYAGTNDTVTGGNKRDWITLAPEAKSVTVGFGNNDKDADSDIVSGAKLGHDEDSMVFRLEKGVLTKDFDARIASAGTANYLLLYNSKDEKANIQMQIDGADSATEQNVILSDATGTYKTKIFNQEVENDRDEDDTKIFYGAGDAAAVRGKVVDLAGSGKWGDKAGYVNIVTAIGDVNEMSFLAGCADAASTLRSGAAGASIFGGAKDDTVLLDDSTGATDTVFLGNGRGVDTVSGFQAGKIDAENKKDAVFVGNALKSITRKDDKVTFETEDGSKLVIAADVNPDADTAIAVTTDSNNYIYGKVGVQNAANTFSYDKEVFAYVGGEKGNTLTVGGDEATTVMLDGRDGKWYQNITAVDASAMTGNVAIAGSDASESIKGGASASSLWGGVGEASDTLIGGTGEDAFFVCGTNDGDDVITESTNADKVVMGMSFGDITKVEYKKSGKDLYLGFNGGGSLTVTDYKDGAGKYELQDCNVVLVDGEFQIQEKEN